MHSTFAVLALAASTALAAPTFQRRAYGNDTSVTVILQDQASETGSQTTFKNANIRNAGAPVGSSGPFSTIEISVGAAAPQALRCQAIDDMGMPIVGVRGANTDITFSDADKGAWTFKEPSVVSQIVCDPAFLQASPDAFDVTVILENQATELGTQTVFEDFVDVETQRPTGSNGPFQTVELSVGQFIDPALRCKVLDNAGRPIILLRGENRDITFSDADKGPWTFEKPQSRVSKIICDPTFVAQKL